jgi:hypothetical protein
LKQAADRFGGVSVLGDDRFQRALLAEGSRVLSAENVEIRLGLRFLQLLGFDQAAKLRDLFADTGGPLGNGLEL